MFQPRQVQFRTQPEFGRVVRAQPHNRMIRRAQYVVNPNAAQMRKALGIGSRRVGFHKLQLVPFSVGCKNHFLGLILMQ